MIRFALQQAEDRPQINSPGEQAAVIAPVPRVSIQAFCDTTETASVINAAAEDRRMGKTQVKVMMGGAEGAAEAYRSAPTPNVIVIESAGSREALLAGLDLLSEVCDAGTKVVVIARHNDILFYRDIMNRGISEYLVAPVGVVGFVKAISELYAAPTAAPVGRTIAVVGAKGGVGASTVAHNIAWAISRDLGINSVIADLDLAFGTAGLDFNQDPPQGIAEAVFSPERVDSAFVDRLLSKCTDHLSLMAAPATLERTYDFTADQLDPIVEVLRGLVPSIVFDVPHVWNAWTRRMLVGADDILIVAAPDLANLRNAKNMIDLLKAARPNDRPPLYLLNQVGVPKRPEIKVADFAKALEREPVTVIPYEPTLFGTAANNGQMISELDGKHKVAETFLQVAQVLTGKQEIRKASKSILSPILEKLKRKQA